MTPLARIQQLEEVARRASPGPWVVDPGYGVTHASREHTVETIHNHGSKSWALYIARADHGHSFDHGSAAEANMEHIAAFNPQQALALLAALRIAVEGLGNCLVWSSGGAAAQVAKDTFARIQEALK